MTPQLLEPPPQFEPITTESWRRWLYSLYQAVGQGGQATFPKLQISNATWTDENAFQELINVDQGIYVNYASTVNQIIYGFACNVIRAAGKALVVGAQINAYAARGVTGTQVFGLATSAIAEPGSDVHVIGYEPDTACLESTSQKVKWGIYNVFKNRGDGVAGVVGGIGSNRFNLYSSSMVLEAQPRSSAGEYSGWNVGIDFHDTWCDQQLPPAWSAGATYIAGMTVTSGGVVWRAIQASTNQLPAAGSAYWVQRTVAGINDLAVGIDFSTMSIASMAKMASAIRLRATELIHWEETGAIGTKFDAVTSIHSLCDNAGTLRLGVHVTTGDPHFGNTPTAPGGGAAATLGTIGGAGPAAAAQNGWKKEFDGAGVAYWVPVWR